MCITRNVNGKRGDNMIMTFVTAIIGVIVICAAVCDWDWFFESSKAWVFVKLFGRNGARVFYGILGIFIFLCSVAAVFAFI